MNCYCTPADVISRVASASGHEAEVLAIIESVSREIDAFCGREFFVTKAVRDFDVLNARQVDLGDVLSIESVGVDSERDATFDGAAWVEGIDYYLEPVNRWPKRWLTILAGSGNALCVRDRSIRVTGAFGYGDEHGADPWQVADGVTGSIGATGRTLTLTDEGGGSTPAPGQTIQIETEQMFVEAVTAGVEAVAADPEADPPIEGSEAVAPTATVIRGVNGTTTAAHDAKAVSVALYPARVRQVALDLAVIDWNLRGGRENSQERFDAYSHMRAGEGAREELKAFRLAGLVRF